MPGPWEKYQAQKPLAIQGPPREPSPQTPAQAQSDQYHAQAAAYAPAQSAAQAEHTRLENLRMRRELGLEPATTAGNTSLTGEDYLKTLSPADAAIVKGMAEGRVGLPAGYAMRSPRAMQLLSAAAQYDPSFDAGNLPARIATRKMYTSGAQGKNIVSLNTALGHLDSLARSTEKLDNFDGVPVINSLLNAGRNAYLSNTGGRAAQPLSQFGIDQQAVVNEMERVFSGTGGTVSALKEWEGKINASRSPSELRAAISEGAKLLQSRLDALHQGYNAGMGTTDQELPFLNPHARDTISALQSPEYLQNGYKGALGVVRPNGGPGASPGAPGTPPGGPQGGGPPKMDPNGYFGFEGAPDSHQGQIVGVEPGKFQAWQQFASQFRPKQMDDAHLAAAFADSYQRMTGRPMLNADAVAAHYNQTGKLSGDLQYQPTGDLKSQMDKEQQQQTLIHGQDISAQRGQGGALETTDALMRAAANGLTYGLADKLAAAGSPGDYRSNIAHEQAVNQYDTKNHFPAQIAGAALGMVANETGLARAPMIGNALSKVPTGWRPLANDALYGGAYGAVNNDGNLAGSVAKDAVATGLGGIAGRTVGGAVGRVVSGVGDTSVRYLADRGIPMTLGQIAGQGGRVGQFAKAAEDKLMSLPIIGDVIKGRRAEGYTEFNREAFRQGLEPVAQPAAEIPASVMSAYKNGKLGPAASARVEELTKLTNPKIGEQGIQDAKAAVSGPGGAYDKALAGVQVNFSDPVFARDLGNAIGNGQRLHPEQGKYFETLMKNEVAPVIANGGMSGEEYQYLRQVIRQERASFAGQPGGRQYGQVLRQVEGSLESIVRRQAPGVVQDLNAANSAYGNVKTLEKAVGKGVNTGGQFTPAQLGLEARASAAKFGSGPASTDRPFFDLQRSAQNVLPSTVPDSGTAGRAALGALLPVALGGGGSYFGADDKTVAAMAALGLPFTKTGQTAFQKLLVERPDIMRMVGSGLMRPSVNAGLFGAPAASAGLITANAGK